MTFVSRLAVASLLALSPAAASAHHLWLESSDAGTHVYFGEFGENLREVSPGRLGRLQPQAKAMSATGEQVLAIDKSPTGFVVTGKIDKGDSVIAADLRSPVQVRTRDGVTTRTLYRPAARFVPDFAPRKPALELDVVPAGDGKLQVFFKGKPLAKSKVEIISASGWVREAQTGEDGGFAVALPWRGTYVIEVQHADRTPGKAGEEAYDVVAYVTTLTVAQPTGLDPLPAPPAGKAELTVVRQARLARRPAIVSRATRRSRHRASFQGSAAADAIAPDQLAQLPSGRSRVAGPQLHRWAERQRQIQPPGCGSILW